MAVLSRRTPTTANARRVNEQALLDATLALLGEGSAFADLSIDQIVKRAGLSRPTFYAYFEDKRALVLRLGTDLEQDLASVAEPWLASAQGSVRDTLGGVLDVFRRHAPVVRAITEAATYDPEVAASWQAFHDRFIPGAETRIAAGAGKLSRKDVAARAYALVWMTERTLTEHVAHATVAETALLDQLAWLWEAATGGSAS